MDSGRVPIVRIAFVDADWIASKSVITSATEHVRRAVARSETTTEESALIAELLDVRSRGSLVVAGLELQGVNLKPSTDRPLNLSGVRVFGIDGCRFDGSDSERGTAFTMCATTIDSISNSRFERVSFRGAHQISVQSGEHEDIVEFLECGLADSTVLALGGNADNITIEWCDLRGADVSSVIRSGKITLTDAVAQFQGCCVGDTTKLPYRGLRSLADTIQKRWPEASDPTKTDRLEAHLSMRTGSIFARADGVYRVPFLKDADPINPAALAAAAKGLATGNVGAWVDAEAYATFIPTVPRQPLPSSSSDKR